MQKAISTQLTNANIAKVITLLTDIPTQLTQVSTTLSPAQLREPFAPNERSFTETLAHLLYCEARTAEAIYLALLVDQPLLANVHPERDWGKLLRYDQLDFAELLAYFQTRRAMLLRVLTNLNETQWARTVREVGKQRQESVYWQARGQALHELEHLTDLQAKLAKHDNG
jgi:hypothetical protein